MAAKKKSKRRSRSGPSGKNRQPQYLLRDAKLPEWQEKARRDGKTFADWIRERLDA